MMTLAANVTSLVVDVSASAQPAEKSLLGVADSIDKMAGSASKATGPLGRADKAVDDYAKSADKAADKAADLGETFGNTASQSGQVAGAFGDLGGALAQMGGPLGAVGSGMEALGPSIMGVTGFADLAEVAMGKFGLAQKAAAVGSWLLTAAMNALPFIAIGAAVVLLGVLFWKFHDQIFDAVGAAFDFVHNVFDDIIDFFKQWGPLALAVLVPFIGIPLLIFQHFDEIKDFLGKAFGNALGAVTGFVAQTVGIIAGLPGKLLAVGTDLFNAGASLMGSLWRGMQSIAGGITDAFVAGFKGALNSAVIAPFNTLIGLVNKAIDAYNKIPLVPNIPHIPEIPRLAAGGIVTRPTLALIGEAGPEAVIPLGRGRGGGAGLGSTVNITVNVPATANPAETGREVARVLRSFFDAGGRLQVPV
jgi:phage-related protein